MQLAPPADTPLVTTSDGPAPGWYDDGVTPHVERWFDGRDWTERTRPVPAPAAPPPPPPPPPVALVTGQTSWQPAAPPPGWAPAQPAEPVAAVARPGGTGGWSPAAGSARFGTAPALAAPPVGAGWSAPAGGAGWGATPPGPGLGRTAVGAPGGWPVTSHPIAAWMPPAYAHWGWRVLAYVLDDLLAWLPYGLAGVYAFATAEWTVDAYGYPVRQPTQTAGVVTLVAALVGLAVWGWNRWVRQARTGQSLGKRAVGIRLVSQETDAPPGVWMCLVRDVAHVLDSFVLYLGWLWPLWDAKRQTLADKAVRTVVLRDPA